MAKVAFLFPGQGAQAVGMGKGLYDELPAARALFDRASDLLGFDLKSVCFEGPAEALEATDVSQPAIFVASLAALESLKATDPDLVASAAGAAGLSLGEYTALAFAGSIDFETGLKVVRRRGQAMQAAAVAVPSGMTSVLGLDEAAIDELCAASPPRGGSGRRTCSGPATSSSRASGGARPGRGGCHRAGRVASHSARRRRRVPLADHAIWGREPR